MCSCTWKHSPHSTMESVTSRGECIYLTKRLFLPISPQANQNVRSLQSIRPQVAHASHGNLGEWGLSPETIGRRGGGGVDQVDYNRPHRCRSCTHDFAESKAGKD
jgi:hypothetical protein